MRNNYILVDYENVHNIDLSCIQGKNFYVKIFIGTHQTKIPIDLVLKSQELGKQVEWIQINGSGKNALDFHITFVLGRLVEKDPDGFFHIISKDTGFDPLIIYLKSQKIFCKRGENVSLIAEIQSPTTVEKDNKTQIVLDDICKIIVRKITAIDKKSRPKSESALKNHIKSLLGLKEITPSVNEVYQKLLNSKQIHFNQSKKIEYNF